MPTLFKMKKFLIGTSFLLILMALSLANTIFNESKIRQIPFIYGKNGELEKVPPYPLFDVFPLGSDMYGYDLLHTVIEGAKFTIGITLIVTVFRLLLPILVSYFLFRLPEGIFKWVKRLGEPLSFFPQTLIAYFMLRSVIMYTFEGFHHPFWIRALYEMVILVVVAVPALTIQLADQKRMVWNEEFVQAALTLGGSKRHVYFKHILPQLYEEWILIFGQQFLQVLTLLVHLGVLKVLFGGTILGFGFGGGDPPSSVTHEWSGLIGINARFLLNHQWIVYVPILFFTMTALSVAMINKALKDWFSTKENDRQNRIL